MLYTYVTLQITHVLTWQTIRFLWIFILILYLLKMGKVCFPQRINSLICSESLRASSNGGCERCLGVLKRHSQNVQE